MKVTTSNARDMNLIRGLLFGDSGMGKTTSLRTLPEDSTLIICMERGTIPLRDKNYRVIVCETWEDIRAIMKALQGGKTATDGTLTVTIEGQEFSGIKVVAIDSLGECNDLCKRQIVEVDRRALISDRTDGKRETMKGIYDDLMGQEDYNLLASRMRGFISAMIHLPIHVIFTSIALWQENKKTGETMKTSALNGQLAFQVNQFFGYSIHMESTKDAEGKDIRVWRTYNDGQHLCKDESSALAPFEHPNWGNVFKKILAPKAKPETKKEEKQHANVG